MSHCERLSNGTVVQVTEPLTEEERAALTTYFDAIRAHLQAREDALTPEERAAADAKRQAGRDRVRRIRERAQQQPR